MTPKASRLDRVWLAIIIAVGFVLSAYLAESLFESTVSASGLLCVALTAIGRREGYLFGLYNSLSYSILAYGNGLYGEIYLNLFFFVPTGIVGYLMWSRHLTHEKTVEMRQLDWPKRLIIAAISIACTVGLGVFLGLNPLQNTPFIDAATNVLSIVATFLMMWRYKEQWYLYILLNSVTVFMWYLRFREGGAAGDLMILMWSLFLLNALYGCWRWHVGTKMARVAGSCENTKVELCDVA